MKKNVLFFLLGCCATLLFSFASIYEPTKATAEVYQMDGYYIFVDSKPVKEYETLGEIKVGFVSMDPQYKEIREALLKKARKKHPDGEGIICYFNSTGFDKADVIKFK